MIIVEHHFSTSWNVQCLTQELASVDETALRYRVLLGDLILRVDGQDFSAQWGWVPIIDLAASLLHICDELNKCDPAYAEFEFTESEATLTFGRDGDFVLISASYRPGRARVLLTEFSAAVQGFVHRLIEDIKQQFPALLQNKLLHNLLKIPS